MLSSKLPAAFLRSTLRTPARCSFLPRTRGLLTLAIETSCDDTSVAILDKDTKTPGGATKILFLENVTPNLTQFRGICPLEALKSHHLSMANLVNKALPHLPAASEDLHGGHKVITLADGSAPRRKPDFVCATRGPGMRSQLQVGIDTCKGLSVAWQIPFLGVHHMQAHLLTPRLVSSLEQKPESTCGPTPDFPFLSLLVSGGHTMLVNSSSLTDHETLASVWNIAIGDAIDKTARLILPQSLLDGAENTMYGKLLEKFAFPNGSADYADYRAPVGRAEEIATRESPWGWHIANPLVNTRELRFEFSGFEGVVQKIFLDLEESGRSMEHDERVALARETMRVCFEHLGSRMVMVLDDFRTRKPDVELNTLVISGGVAANRFLMTVLRSFLDVRGHGHINIIAPPPQLCSDNAAMIGWAGMEMFEAGWRTDLACRHIQRWPLDAEIDGGILGPIGWRKV